MCRMVAYLAKDRIGSHNLDLVVEHMRRSACDLVGEHEFHGTFGFKQGEFIHGDGWGIAWMGKDGVQVRRELNPLWETSLFDELRDELSSSKFLMIHARKKSPGKDVILESVHPFRADVGDEVAVIAHNGTVPMDNLEWDRRYVPASPDSDTERLFYTLLTKYSTNGDMVTSLREVLPTLGDDYSANLLLIYGNHFLTTSNYSGKNSRPIYLGLKVLMDDEKVVVSSEVIDGFSGEWRTISNGEILEFNVTDHFV